MIAGYAFDARTRDFIPGLLAQKELMREEPVVRLL